MAIFDGGKLLERFSGNGGVLAGSGRIAVAAVEDVVSVRLVNVFR